MTLAPANPALTILTDFASFDPMAINLGPKAAARMKGATRLLTGEFRFHAIVGVLYNSAPLTWP